MKENKDKQDGMSTEQTSSVAGGSVDPNAEIATKLKAFYSSLQDEPIPERFLELLDRLDEAESTSKKG